MYRIYIKRKLCDSPARFLITYRGYWGNLRSLTDITSHYLVVERCGSLSLHTAKKGFKDYKPKFLFAIKDVEKIEEKYPEFFI